MADDIPPKDYIDAVPFPDRIALMPIGIVRSPYRERHGTPRQATVGDQAFDGQPQEAIIELDPEVVPAKALSGLEGFEWVWIIAWLHLNKHWNPTVVPPRGPRVRRGVLATRAPHRPNQLGLSAVRLVRVDGHRLVVHGVDLLDGTPVLDIKPYIPYADAFPHAAAGWVDAIDGRDPADGPGRE